MKRFEPSLLDKLFDDDVRRSAASSALRTLSVEELKATVARDVEALLNTRTPLSEADLETLPECKQSVLTYGLQDFSGLSLASYYDRTFICDAIQQAIAWHEPRLQEVKVSLELKEQATSALYFAIQALLVVHPAEEPVSFDAMLHPSTLRYSVSRARGADGRQR
ncbi:type VI secretion protein [Robbsia andropogonis]|uniref:Type VI secretion protein n=1 Tax=Robbsia andropogonis TaxID=28092 RepID=A0A0F5K5G6_9BURK|nr:type VI secretion system baseplate subunit TssE [Robbsia andropogonis]KKB65343.1 type VI secretion protein [Robbsia andropogonis]